MEPETRTEGLGNKNNTVVLTDEANSFINGTHFGRIDAIKAMVAVSVDDDATRPSIADRCKSFSCIHIQ
jgi:hypothetical protein